MVFSEDINFFASYCKDSQKCNDGKKQFIDLINKFLKSLENDNLSKESLEIKNKIKEMIHYEYI